MKRIRMIVKRGDDSVNITRFACLSGDKNDEDINH